VVHATVGLDRYIVQQYLDNKGSFGGRIDDKQDTADDADDSEILQHLGRRSQQRDPIIDHRFTLHL